MLKVRLAKIEDALAIAEIHVATWKTTYAGIVPEEYLSNLSAKAKTQSWSKTISESSNENSLFVCEDSDQKILGFVCAGKEREPNCGFDGEIYAIYVDKDRQQKGVGGALIAELKKWFQLNHYKNFRLWVLENNSARTFYEKMGGQLLRETKSINIGGKLLLEVGYGWNLGL